MDHDFTVGIYRGHDHPDINRQIPGHKSIWGNVRFLIDDITEPCEVLVVLNSFRRELNVECGEVWQIIQEPPIDLFPWIFEGKQNFDRIYSPLCSGNSFSRCRLSHGALPWHIEKSYDELKGLLPKEKKKELSWITSDKAIFEGHKDRMDFLKKLQNSGIDFDLYGRGFTTIPDKYSGLKDYKYSLAIENYSGPHYWTEKIADCFLSWTMPIYSGCTNLADYFPKESFVEIDLRDSNVFDKIKEVIKSNVYFENRDAIKEARRLVLDEYQLFPFIANRLGEKKDFKVSKKKFFPYSESFRSKLGRRFKRFYRG